MRLNSVRTIPAGYDQHPPLKQSPLSGPDDLAWLLNDYRKYLLAAHAGDRDRLSPLSEAGICRLISLTFYASTVPEEGRFLRFNLVNRAGDQAPVTSFDPVELDVNRLRRLGPACTNPECALRVVERDGRLWCDGIVRVGARGADVAPGSPTFFGPPEPPSLHVRVEGPGHLVVLHDVMAYELRAGAIRHLGSFLAVPAIRQLTRELLAFALDRADRQGGTQGKKCLEGVLCESSVRAILSRAVRFAVEARHGGAFVLLPGDAQDPGRFSISAKYRGSDLDLAADLVDFWATCIQARQKHEQPGYSDALRAWNRSRARMLTDADVLGNLSCIDGCVVLNGRLRVLGFGAEIRVTDEQVRTSPRAFRNFVTQEVWSDDEFLGGIGGTRHKSAARLCKAHAGVSALVVSQDGELKIFSSDEQNVYAFGPLDSSFPHHPW